MGDRTYLPRVYTDLRAEHPDIAAAYDALGHACREAGPLTEREQRLVKLGIAIGLSSEGAVRSHVRRGLAEGLTRAELAHAVAIAVPTAGFPATAAAYRWAGEVFAAGEREEPDPA
ncbi:MAG: carboxymuconolactone decarboxylase family protein [Chloroflexi bacterium]|jgi:alkylhydroperoxidase/carboxymuconolactone decarboxylase family protein YurZ|nr:carboxymuconolactone decarboxylase family protein [Chloroflexota bacterium]